MNRAARHRNQRQRRQAERQRPTRVLEYTRHHAHRVPFIVFETQRGSGMRLVIGPRGGIKFHHFAMDANDHSGRRELPPEEWPDPVCVHMAKLALIEGA